jgi:hypothetical protein
MNPPFSREQFFTIMTAYNEAVFPVQLIFVAIALLGLAVLFARAHTLPQLLAFTGVLWLWIAVAYFISYFARMNRSGYLFATAFVLQGLLILKQSRVASPRADDNTIGIAAGITLIAYALIAYPALGYVLGQRYPAFPTFGLPCPTTIFTLGVFAFAGPALPARLLIVPGLWAVVATSAAVNFGVVEDYALLPAVAALIVLRFTWHLRARASRLQSHPAFPAR